MAKTFEDYFSEYQTEMIAVCLEYANYDVDKVYIYCSSEGRMQATDYFFEINGKHYERHQLGMSGKKYDTSSKRQSACNRIILEALWQIKEKCKEYDRPMPTEMKIVYDAKKNSVDANYRYDLVYSKDPDALPDPIFDAWFAEVKKTEK